MVAVQQGYPDCERGQYSWTRPASVLSTRLTAITIGRHPWIRIASQLFASAETARPRHGLPAGCSVAVLCRPDVTFVALHSISVDDGSFSLGVKEHLISLTELLLKALIRIVELGFSFSRRSRGM